MKHTFKYSFILLFLSFITTINAQNKTVNTSNIDFHYTNSNVYISYDIENYSSDELYNITVAVFRENGAKLNAVSLTGDVVETKGGIGKTIIWNQKADGYVLDEKIYITLSIATKVKIPVATHLIKSLAFPGSGDYKIRNGKYHFLYGMVGYGAIGASVYFNYLATKNYEAYKTSFELNPSNNLFNKAKQQQSISSVLAASACVVWTIDLASLSHKSHKVKKQITKENSIYYFEKSQQTNAYTSIINHINTKEPYDIALERGNKLFAEEKYEQAKIAYEEANKHEATETVKNKLESVNKIIEEEKNKTITYNTNIAKGQELITKKQYKEAKAEFELASRIKPKEKHPINQIEEINQVLKQIENQKLYEEQMGKGMNYLTNLDFETAKHFFESALKYKENDITAINKCKQCDNGIAAKEQQRVDKEYKQKMAQANSLLASKKYEDAKELYEQAHDLKPEASESQSRIDECESAIAKIEEAKSNAEYKRLINLADASYNNRQYDKAKGFYTQAQNILPTESYPSIQIQKIIKREEAGIEDKPANNQAEIYKICKEAVFKIINSKPGYEGSGTGFFIASSGIAITNFHNLNFDINEQYYIKAKLDNGDTYQLGKVLHYSEEYDYIVFQIENPSNKIFKYLKPSKKEPEEFEAVFCIGYPLGLDKIPSEGTVSRYIGKERSLICTNVDITHGSSGGPLLNMKGEVVGITSYGLKPEKFGADAGVNFINFAINILILKNKGDIK